MVRGKRSGERYSSGVIRAVISIHADIEGAVHNPHGVEADLLVGFRGKNFEIAETFDFVVDHAELLSKDKAQSINTGFERHRVDIHCELVFTCTQFNGLIDSNCVGFEEDVSVLVGEHHDHALGNLGAIGLDREINP